MSKTPFLTWVALALAGLALSIASGAVGGKADSIFETSKDAGAITSTTKAIIKAAGFTTTGDLTVNGGTSATSTAVLGGIETFATSTATKICLWPSNTGATSTFAGTVYWKYGSCP